ncbi:MAG: PIN domain-containing protein [Deltaproteobacteria bacterium]|nr:PIN domain-containing protein [Deltaproteobacteria bacterium]
MILVDTSVWIEVLKDKTGNVVRKFREQIGKEIVVFSRFIQLELLQGAKNELEWRRLDEYLETQYYLETTESTWRHAARIYFDLRKSGITVRSPIDCCIACIALESQALLLHRDRDFEKIADVRSFDNKFFIF